jgi:lysophospholipase L1-like esterase
MARQKQCSFFIFGDSIAFGQFVPSYRTWANALSRRIGARFADRDWRMANVSISGNTTRQALERIGYDVQAHRPTFLYVQFGMNDCNIWQTDNGCTRVSVEAFAANLTEIAARAFAWGAKHIWFGTNHPAARPVAGGGIDAAYQSRNVAYNANVRDVVSSIGDRATLVDHEAAWRRKPGRREVRLLPDGVHLADAGHELYDGTVWRAIYPVLDRHLDR